MYKISFSGIDGSGKSTQINKLCEVLKKNGLTYKSYHLFSKRQSLMSEVHETAIGKKILNRIRTLKNSPFNNFIKISSRIGNVTLDSIITTKRNNSLKEDVIIYDRYFYDILLCIAYDYPKIQKLIYFITRLIPRPDVIIIFHADPDVVISRKPEHTMESATKYCKLYRNLAEVLKIKPINATNTPDNVLIQILNLCNSHLNENFLL